MNVKKLIVFQLLLITVFFSSCSSYKKIPYFTDVPDSAKNIIQTTVEFKNPVIKPDDILAISIQTLDQGMTTFLNAPQMTNSVGSTPTSGAALSAQSQPTTGYLVDKNGDIELAFAGNLKVAGLTTFEAKDLITTELAKNFNNPVVNVRFANFKITVLGEVNRPGTYAVPNEKVDLFDGLGLAGDLTVYGRRDNIIIIRDTGNAKELTRLSLNSKDIIKSPFFYLQSNDVIYVEPSGAKLRTIDADKNRTVALWAGAIALVVAALTKL